MQMIARVSTARISSIQNVKISQATPGLLVPPIITACRVSVHPLSGKSVPFAIAIGLIFSVLFPFATPNCHRELTLTSTLEIKKKVRSNAYGLLAFHYKVCRSSRLVGSYFE